MKLTIKKELLKINIPLTIILLMTYLDSTVFRVRYKYFFIIIFISAVILLVDILKQVLKEKGKINLKGTDLILGIMSILVLFRNKDFLHKDYIYGIIFPVIVGLCVFNPKYLKNCCSVFLNFSYFWGLLSCIVTFICYIFPNFYLTYIFPLAIDDNKPELLYCFERGYYAGFALQYSSNAIFLAMFCGTVVVKLLNSNTKKVKYIFLLIIGFIALFLTAKRAHVIFSIFSIFIVYYIYNSDRKKSRIVKIIGGLILSVFAFTILATIIPELNNVFYRLFNSIERKGELFENRTNLYKYAITVFKESPIIGNGWNSYKYLAEENLGKYIAVHNVYLQLLAEVGILGAIFFYIYFIISLYDVCRYFKKLSLNKKNFCSEDIEIVAFSVFFIIFFLAYSITGNALYESRFIIPFFSFSIYCIKQKAIKGDYNGK